MGILKKIKRMINRPYMPCDFTEGISQEDIAHFADEALRTIRGKKIKLSVDGPVVKGYVQSNSGLSVWSFKIDFNDYGHITGKHWISSENDDSPIPKVIASRMEQMIFLKQSEIK